MFLRLYLFTWFTLKRITYHGQIARFLFKRVKLSDSNLHVFATGCVYWMCRLDV